VLLLAIVQLVLASAMAAAIWFVQLVHYPLYRAVPGSAFAAYHRQHLRRARLTLGLPILGEALAAVALVWTVAEPDTRILAWIGLGLLVLGLALTVTLIERSYRQLTSRLEESSLRSLLHWNLLRAIIWSGNVVIAAQTVRALS
jgi:hypothetical protein